MPETDEVTARRVQLHQTRSRKDARQTRGLRRKSMRSMSLASTSASLEQPSTDWLALCASSPGWQWPEDSQGVGPMYGHVTWWRDCGTPLTGLDVLRTSHTLARLCG